MSIGLKISLGLNVFLLGFILFFSEEPQPEVRERLIIETHKEQLHPKEPVSAMSVMPKPEVKKAEEKAKSKNNDSEEEKEFPEFMPMDTYEIQESGQRMEEKRMEFMTDVLGMSEDKIQEHNRIRDEFHRESSKFWARDPMRELTFSERREMINLEEDLHKKLEKLHGKENWKKYQKFREDYNNKGYQRQMKDGQPFIFMTL